MSKSLDQIEWRLLLSRFLTRSGDQAWDFAVPISLMMVFPGQIQVAAIYYFLIRLGHVILMPSVASLIDHHARDLTARVGVTSQALAVIFQFVALWGLWKISAGSFVMSFFSVALFAAMCLVGLLSDLGATVMQIAVSGDVVPTAVPLERLSAFNSRIRQIDLFTEVSSPILTGLLLLVAPPEFPLAGLLLVVLWNIFSFIPEYHLLMTIFRLKPQLRNKLHVPVQTSQSIVQKITDGWRTFFKEPVAPAIICYALLWLSVLSPHGVLLTGFLKGGWALPELTIGIFRGAGALFGLSATFLFPWVLKRFSLNATSEKFLWFQAITVSLGLISFIQGTMLGQYSFLVFILLSRIGLYGFSLGEEQIRQTKIPESVRGKINGFGSALTGVATLFLYGAGAKLSSTDDFKYLISGSVIAVILAAIIFSLWSRNQKLHSTPSS